MKREKCTVKSGKGVVLVGGPMDGSNAQAEGSTEILVEVLTGAGRSEFHQYVVRGKRAEWKGKVELYG